MKDKMECVAFLMIRKTHLLVLRRWFDQHKSVKKNKKKSRWVVVLQIWRCLETEARQSFLSMDSTKSTWGQASLSMLLQGISSHALHVFIVSLSSRPVGAVLTETPTTTPLCEFYLCLPHSGSPQLELLPYSLSCGFASDGVRRTSWRPSWRGAADPDWRSAPLKWWERRKRAHDPGIWEHCCTQSLWQCWGSLGALPAASSPECSAKWKHAFSCGKEDGRRKAGWWVFMGIGCV